jgi:recombinational DNA repair ATPase RecF
MRSSDGNRDMLTELHLETGKRKYTVNGKPKGISDVRGILPAVVFSPDDLNLAKGSSSVKRSAFDEVGVQLSRNYSVIGRDFEKALRYKNRLLKEEAPQPLVDAINETFVACGAQLFCYRHALYRTMSGMVAEGYGDIARSGEELSVDYTPRGIILEIEKKAGGAPAGWKKNAFPTGTRCGRSCTKLSLVTLGRSVPATGRLWGLITIRYRSS